MEDGEDGGPSMSRLYRVGGWLPTLPSLSRSFVTYVVNYLLKFLVRVILEVVGSES